MVNVTKAAVALLLTNLDAHRPGKGDIVRVSRNGGGLSLAMGARENGDVVIQLADGVILVMEPSIADELGEAIIDTSAGAQLIIKLGGHEYVD